MARMGSEPWADLVFGSPPYEDKRWYGALNFKRKAQDWVDWMFALIEAMLKTVKPLCLVALVVGHGKTDDHRWSGTPALLMADLVRAGKNLRNPPIYRRVGVSGSGANDYFRADYETVVVVQNGRGEVPWSNNVAVGHKPRYGPGGCMSNRLANGSRRNQWGGSDKGIGTRRANGKVQGKQRPSHEVSEVHGRPDGDDSQLGLFVDALIEDEKAPPAGGAAYRPPVYANPGNVRNRIYTAEEVADMLAEYEQGDVIDCVVGGGMMGHPMAHQNEAPFPLELAEAFVLSFCPPGGLVYEPFGGSGTTVHAAVENRRRCVATDERADQVDLIKRRMQGVTPRLMVEADERYETQRARKVARKKKPAAPAPDEAPG